MIKNKAKAVKIGKFCRRGKNKLEVLVLNTLAPYLRAQSPTHFILQGQTESGMFGPVKLEVGK